MGKLLEAVKSEDRRQSLIELRNLLVIRLENCDSSRDIASLSRRLMEVMDEIDALGSPDDQSAIRKMQKRVAEGKNG